MVCIYTGMGLHCHLVCHLTSYAIIACPTSWPYTLRSFVRSKSFLTCSIKPCPFVITRKLCGCDDTHQDMFFFWGCESVDAGIKMGTRYVYQRCQGTPICFTTCKGFACVHLLVKTMSWGLTIDSITNVPGISEQLLYFVPSFYSSASGTIEFQCSSVS